MFRIGPDPFKLPFKLIVGPETVIELLFKFIVLDPFRTKLGVDKSALLV